MHQCLLAEARSGRFGQIQEGHRHRAQRVRQDRPHRRGHNGRRTVLAAMPGYAGVADHHSGHGQRVGESVYDGDVRDFVRPTREAAPEVAQAGRRRVRVRR